MDRALLLTSLVALAPAAALADSSSPKAAKSPCQGLDPCVKRCDAGEPMACYSAAQYYESGDGVAASRGEATRLYTKGCGLGGPDACARVAELMQIDEAKVDPAKLADAYRKSCDAGSGRACGDLGYLHRKGNGVPLDEKKGFALAARGHKIAEGRCKSGHALSCEYLGLENLLGTGGLKPNAQAGLKYLDRACQLDGTYGCDRLAMCYEGQMGVAPDPKRAAAATQRSCAAGSVQACEKAKAPPAPR